MPAPIRPSPLPPTPAEQAYLADIADIGRITTRRAQSYPHPVHHQASDSLAASRPLITAETQHGNRDKITIRRRTRAYAMVA